MDCLIFRVMFVPTLRAEIAAQTRPTIVSCCVRVLFFSVVCRAAHRV
jgi:hypothetical protein